MGIDLGTSSIKTLVMVLNVGAVKSGDWKLAKDDIAAVTASVSGKALVKVIIETGLLTDEEKVKACEIAKLAGADFVKTCTGFTDGKATPEDVSLMRETVGNDMDCIRKIRMNAPVKSGTVAVRDILGLGADLIITRDVPAEGTEK